MILSKYLVSVCHLVAMVACVVALREISLKLPVDDLSMRFTISDSQIEEATHWNESDFNPPLSIRDAIRRSRMALDDFRAKSLVQKDVNWSLDSVTLVAINESK